MVSETLDLVTGGITAVLPMIVFAVPAFALLLGPLLVVGVALALIGGILALVAAPPVLLVRWLRRR